MKKGKQQEHHFIFGMINQFRWPALNGNGYTKDYSTKLLNNVHPLFRFLSVLIIFFCNTNKRSNLRSGYLFNILRIFLSLSSSTHFLVSTPIKTTNIIIGVFLQQQHSMHIQNQTTIYHTSIVWSELRAPDKDNYLHAKMRENDEYFFDEI